MLSVSLVPMKTEAVATIPQSYRVFDVANGLEVALTVANLSDEPHCEQLSPLK